MMKTGHRQLKELAQDHTAGLKKTKQKNKTKKNHKKSNPSALTPQSLSITLYCSIYISTFIGREKIPDRYIDLLFTECLLYARHQVLEMEELKKPGPELKET